MGGEIPVWGTSLIWGVSESSLVIGPAQDNEGGGYSVLAFWMTGLAGEWEK